VFSGLKLYKCRSVKHFSKLSQETQSSAKDTLRTASKVFCSYLGRSLCIGSCSESPWEKALWQKCLTDLRFSSLSGLQCVPDGPREDGDPPAHTDFL